MFKKSVFCVFLSLFLLTSHMGVSEARKPLPPIGVNMSLKNNHVNTGIAVIEVVTKSLIDSKELNLLCGVSGEPESSQNWKNWSFSLDADKEKTVSYSLDIDSSKYYKIVCTVKMLEEGINLGNQSSLEINVSKKKKVKTKPLGVIKKLPGDRGYVIEMKGD